MAPKDDAARDRKRRSPRVELLHRRVGTMCLRVLEGPRANPDEILRYRQRRVLGGRAAAADLCLRDWALDEVHFVLWVEGEQVWLEDLGSTRGTFIGDSRVGTVGLVPGAVFTVGSSAIQLVGLESEDVPISSRDHFGGLHGRSPAMREAFAQLEAAIDTDLDVVLQGEAGTGKALAARAIHEQSTRRDGPFVVLDCSTFNAELAAITVVGHVAGFFPGAKESRAGCFEQADGGTIFIDGLDQLPPDLQPKLARAIDRREVMRFGETQPRRVDLRVIVSTRQNLRHMIAEGALLEYLYYRLSPLVIELPPLREREGDVAMFIERFAEELGAPAWLRSEDVLARLCDHRWPGNVRELRRVVQRAIAMGEEGRRHPERLTEGPSVRVPAFAELAELPYEDAYAAFERHYLTVLLRATKGELGEAERRSGITPERLLERLRKHGLPV
jgi:DNA-binding NtrC family response regulator